MSLEQLTSHGEVAAAIFDETEHISNSANAPISHQQQNDAVSLASANQKRPKENVQADVESRFNGGDDGKSEDDADDVGQDDENDEAQPNQQEGRLGDDDVDVDGGGEDEDDDDDDDDERGQDAFIKKRLLQQRAEEPTWRKNLKPRSRSIPLWFVLLCWASLLGTIFGILYLSTKPFEDHQIVINATTIEKIPPTITKTITFGDTDIATTTAPSFPLIDSRWLYVSLPVMYLPTIAVFGYVNWLGWQFFTHN